MKDIARWHIYKDGQECATTTTREEAIAIIRQYQAQETHYLLKSNFSLIFGAVEFIEYETPRKMRKRA